MKPTESTVTKGNRMNKFYQGRYLIAAYYGGPQNDENLYGVYNNPADLAVQTGRSIDAVRGTLAHIMHQSNGANSTGMRFYKRNENGEIERNKYLTCTIHFIELTDEEIESGDFDNYD